MTDFLNFLSELHSETTVSTDGTLKRSGEFSMHSLNSMLNFVTFSANALHTRTNMFYRTGLQLRAHLGQD